MQDMCPAQAEPAILRTQYWACGPDVCARTGRVAPAVVPGLGLTFVPGLGMWL